tara:strand:+ start:2413 stop:2691 length:279 start_codon:yes stop_codon:yes gene_type:complete
MKYRDMIDEMYGISKPIQKKIVKETKVEKKYFISEDIRNSQYYNSVSPLDQYNLERYMGKDIKLFEGTVGFSKTDSLVNGVEIPFKYLKVKK